MNARATVQQDGEGWVDVSGRWQWWRLLPVAVLFAVGAGSLPVFSMWLGELPPAEARAKAILAGAVVLGLFGLLAWLCGPLAIAVGPAGVRRARGRRSVVHAWADLEGIALGRPTAADGPLLLLSRDSVHEERLRAAVERHAPECGRAAEPAAPTESARARPTVLNSDLWAGLSIALFGGLAAVGGLVLFRDRPELGQFVCATSLPTLLAMTYGGTHREWRRTVQVGRQGVDVGGGAARLPWSRISAIVKDSPRRHRAALATGVWPNGLDQVLTVPDWRGTVARVEALRAAGEGAPGNGCVGDSRRAGPRRSGLVRLADALEGCMVWGGLVWFGVCMRAAALRDSGAVHTLNRASLVAIVVLGVLSLVLWARIAISMRQFRRESEAGG